MLYGMLALCMQTPIQVFLCVVPDPCLTGDFPVKAECLDGFLPTFRLTGDFPVKVECLRGFPVNNREPVLTV